MMAAALTVSPLCSAWNPDWTASAGASCALVSTAGTRTSDAVTAKRVKAAKRRSDIRLHEASRVPRRRPRARPDRRRTTDDFVRASTNMIENRAEDWHEYAATIPDHRS